VRNGRYVRPEVLAHELSGISSKTKFLSKIAPYAVASEFLAHDKLGDHLTAVVGATLFATKTVPEIEKAVRGYQLLQNAFPKGGRAMHRVSRNLYMMNNAKPLATAAVIPITGAAAAYLFNRYKKRVSDAAVD
jgi:hypothetical protein